MELGDSAVRSDGVVEEEDDDEASCMIGGRFKKYLADMLFLPCIMDLVGTYASFKLANDCW